jgi:hypothetical protein
MGEPALNRVVFAIDVAATPRGRSGNNMNVNRFSEFLSPASSSRLSSLALPLNGLTFSRGGQPKYGSLFLCHYVEAGLVPTARSVHSPTAKIAGHERPVGVALRGARSKPWRDGRVNEGRER